MIYIYALCCPETGVPRYIGKCKNLNARFAGHISKAKGRHTTHHCANWIVSLLDRQMLPTITVLEELPDAGDWQAAEAAAIKSHRAQGHDLTNLTGGGDGFHDVPPDVARRRGQSRSRTLQDPANKAKFLAALAGSHTTDRARENHSTATRSAWADPAKSAKILSAMRTPEALERRAEAARNRPRRAPAPRPHDAHVRAYAKVLALVACNAKRSEVLRDQWADPESRRARESAINREKMTASAKAKWSDPVHRAAILAARSTPEARKKHMDSIIRRNTPEYRAQKAEETRRSWEKRRQTP